MTPEEFRENAHTFVDWMADYLASVENYPVRSLLAPGDVLATLPDAAPDAPEAMADIFADFQRDVLPGITHWQHPSFFAYFPANSSPPSLLAEMLTSTLAAQCMLWQTSPAGTEMETRMMEWLRDMLGLPAEFRGVIQDSATSSTLSALLVGREKATGWRGNEDGLCALGAEGVKLTVYVSEEAHSSIEKTMKVVGYGRACLRSIAADDDFAMRPEQLRQAIERDIADGFTPACVTACIGGTGTGAIDPLRAIGEICREYDIWLHVDAAWAGSALILPEYRDLLDGIEYVDSFVFNPHKWLMTNFDCTAFYVRDTEALERTLALVPEFLKSREADAITDYQNWSVPLGRRFRALKLWFVIRSYGVSGLQDRIRRHIELAGLLFDQVSGAPDFDIVSPLRLALFSFRYHPPGIDDEAALDALNEKLLNALNDSGDLYLTQNRVRGRYAIRFSVGQTNTEERHIDAAWAKIRETAAALT
jgi:aromatic-L-amino-acid decarboxylase